MKHTGYLKTPKDYKFGQTSDINVVIRSYRRLKLRAVICKLFYAQRLDIDLLERILKKKWSKLLTQRNHEELWHARLDGLIEDISLAIVYLNIDGFYIIIREAHWVLQDYNEWSLLADQFL